MEKGKGQPGDEVEPFGPEANPPTGGMFGGFMGQFIVPLVLALVVAWGMVSVMAAPKSAYRADITRLETDLVSARDSIAAGDTQLTNRINSLEGGTFVKPADLAPYAQKAELGNYATVATLNATNAEIAALKARVVKLEATKEEEEASEETVRWKNWELDFKPALPGGFTYRIEFDKIEEPGLYDIEIEVRNATNVNPVTFDSVLTMVIEPKGDIMVDVDATSLWFADDPWTEWDADFKTVERGDNEWCRRIIFSSYHRYGFGVLGIGERIRLELEFELYYLE